MPRSKSIFLIAFCLFLLWASLPNFFSMPSWFSAPKINLGLDLRGGSYLLLQVDDKSYLHEQYEHIASSLRQDLRKNHIAYRHLKPAGDMVSLELINPDDFAELKKLISKLHNGLDNKEEDGKVYIYFSDRELTKIKADLVDQSIEIIRRRVDETGTKEPIIQKTSGDRIILQVPGMDNPEELKSLLGKTAKLTFHLVIGMTENRYEYTNNKLVPDSSQENLFYILEPTALLSGDHLINAQTSFDQNKFPVVAFTLNNIGAKKFAEITRSNSGKAMAIVLDNKVISAPRIKEPILGGSGIITGNFTIQSAGELALLLRAGALPAELHIIEERNIGPSLGADSIEAGKIASIVALIAIIIFMYLSYGLFGIFADIALICSMLFIITVLSLLQATLTMPGIAGIILTIGMAVDANVLIFERIRDELRVGKSIRFACEQGFRNVLSAIIDSNITTLIVAILLYLFGSGPIRGFAVTLAIGIFASFFGGIIVTRSIINWWLSRYKPKNLFL